MALTEPLLQVYWRPGCAYCTSLRAALNDAGVEATWRNIHDDADAAAFVRSVAHGNETVPTVAYEDHVLVAPRPARLIADLQATHPELVTRPHRTWPPLRVAQWAGVIALILISELLARSGRSAASWATDVVAIAFYVSIRWLRTRPRTMPEPSTARRTSTPRSSTEQEDLPRR